MLLTIPYGARAASAQRALSKDTKGRISMKRILLALLIIVLTLGLASCINFELEPSGVCQHRDADDNYVCDSCGSFFADGDDLKKPPECEHRDADDDSLCDECDEPFSDGKDLDDDPPACQHRDANDNSLCDKCGEPFSDGKDINTCQHRDANDNSLCDKCGEPFSDGKDINDDTTCQHRDANDDSLCDECDEPFSDGKDIEDHVHIFDNESTDEKYLASEADCTTPAKYYYSCSCGEIGTEVFNYGTTLRHNYVSGSCTECGTAIQYSDSLEFTSNGDGTCYVSGIGTCKDIDIIVPYTHNGWTVTGIGQEAFSGRRSLRSVWLPDTITAIDHYAFEDCTKLVELVIPDSVTYIGDDAFYGCSGIIEENGGLHYVGDWVVNADESIKRAMFKENTVGVAAYSFMDCDELVSVTLNSGLTHVCEDAFDSARKLVEVINNSSLPIQPLRYTDYGGVGRYALVVHNEETKIVNEDGYLFITVGGVNYLVGYEGDEKNLTLPEGYHGQTYVINDYAFYNCHRPRSVVISEGVTSIGEGAFQSCYNITALSIPSSVIRIKDLAFLGCDNLIQVNNGVHYVDNWAVDCEYEVTSVALRGDTVGVADRAFYGNINIESVTLPTSLRIIGERAFGGCKSLSGITIRDSVISIGDGAFYSCTSLTYVTLGNGVISIGEAAFMDCENLATVIMGNNVMRIGDSAFSRCSRLISVFVNYDSYVSYPSDFDYDAYLTGAVGMGDGVFAHCVNLDSVQIPSSLTNIGDDAFHGCVSLTEIEIPSTIKIIGTQAFFNCESLQSITFPNSIEVVEEVAFIWCFNLKEVHISDIASWCSISFEGSGANPLSYASRLYLNGELVKDLTIPDEVTSIGECAFSGYVNLNTVTIPNGVTSIGSYAFNGCINLSSVHVPDSVTSIGILAFAECTRLGEITVGTANLNYQSIDGSLYSKDGTTLIQYPIGKSDKSYVVPDGTTVIADYAFSRCQKLTDIVIADSVIRIGESAFDCCENLFNVTLGNSIQIIDKSAFFSCTGIVTITIPESVKSIGNSAFWGCGRLAEVINKSELSITEGERSHGYVAYNALIVHSGKSLIVQQGDYLFITANNGNYLLKYLGNESEISLPAAYDRYPYYINQYAFYKCTSLKSVSIPGVVYKIGANAFDSCTNLTNVYLSSFNTWYVSVSYEENGTTVEEELQILPADSAKYAILLVYDYNNREWYIK